LEVFLYAPEQFENLCVLARTLEVFGFRRCYVYDPHRLVRERYGKSYAQRLRTVSAGAFQRIEWQRVVGEIPEFLRAHAGRRIATVPRQSATSLHQFRFRRADLLLIGAEGGGLTPDILRECQEQVTIPQAGVTESLNLAVASGIVIAEWRRQEALGLVGD
jgi:tRNA G18 (ribose-2'-O)-methylase SpoU